MGWLSSWFGDKGSQRDTDHDRSATPDLWPLDQRLLRLSAVDEWTIGDAFTGTQIFGDTGSGKTSGSGLAISRAMLKAGFGGLVLTDKSDETDRWRELMASVGRSDDLVVFGPEQPHRFNFLEYERTRDTRGGGLTDNIVELFVAAMTVAEDGDGKKSGEDFWNRAQRQLLRNTIDLIRLADAELSVETMNRVISSAPTCREQLHDPSWRERSYLFSLLVAADEDANLSSSDRKDLDTTAEFWCSQYCDTIPDVTRGNIVQTFTTLADGFLRGTLRELFCTDLTIRPELCTEGKVIVLDLPNKQFHQLGRVAQVLFKLCWQRAVEQQSRGDRDRPLFLWIDEAQFFITPKEAEFVQTVRSHRVACVYLTQSRSNYVNAVGEGRAEAVKSFLGVTKNKIFHCNGDPDTNEWAQRVIAQEWRTQTSFGQNRTRANTGGAQESTTTSRQLEFRVLASEFAALRSGGPMNDGVIEAVWFISGRRFWADGQDSNFIRVRFVQDLGSAG
ncbi:MAG: TraM recognition domain-containing protein [Planctomycetota bacterium]